MGLLATYAYDDLGRRTSLTRGNGTVKSYAYDAVSRLSSLGEDLAGTSFDLTQSFTYNPASQIATATRSNDSYAWSDHYNLTRNYGSNGLNQYISSGSVTPTYDAKGNLTSAGSATYAYSSENLLTSASGGIALAYDPMLRLYQTAGGTPGTTRFAYDGQDLIAEYNGSNAMLRRYVHGPADDEPLVWYEGSGTTDRRFLHSDERGSVIATSNSSGTTLSTNAYDEYGLPKSTNTGRFQFTGQTWLPELGMYYYKARIYSPTLGRFLQTDPIGYGDGMNIYAYVGGDPVNFTDPLGLCGTREVEVARYRTFRPEGDVVALYRLFCQRLREDGGDISGPIAGDRGGGESIVVKLGKTCKGVAEFTAVGPNQAQDKGALAAFGITPDSGTVAVDPNQFGIPYGGSASFNEVAQGQFAPVARQIGIISPAAAARSALYGGPSSSFFRVGDVGDKNVRSGSILRFDLYRFSTQKGALGFGRVILPVIITNVPLDMACPPGTTEI